MDQIRPKEKMFYFTKQAALVCLTLLVSLAAVEGILRLMYRANQSDDLVVKAPSGLSIMRPNVDAIIMGGADTPVHVKTNFEGFASPEYDLMAPAGTTRIAFLGNSFTKGFEVDFDKKFTSLVEEKLRTDGKAVEIMNFAQGGLSVAEQLIIYREYVRKYRPDVVVLVVYAGYDFPTVQRFLSEREYFLTTPLGEIDPVKLASSEAVFTESQQSLRSKLVEHSEIIRFVIRLVRQSKPLYSLAIKLGLLHQPFTQDVGNYFGEIWSYMDPASAPHREIMDFTTDLVARLGAEVERDGGEFAVVLVPSHWQVDDKFRQDLLTRNSAYDVTLPNKIITERVKKDFTLLDLSPSIEEAINTQGVQIFVHDVGHFTAAGHARAADLVHAFLMANLL